MNLVSLVGPRKSSEKEREKGELGECGGEAYL